MAWAKVVVKVPDVDQTFKSGNYNYGSPAVKNANVNMMKKISKDFSSSMTLYGSLLAIPNGVINAFMCSESGGTPVQKTNPSGAQKYDVWGLMAISPAAFFDAFVKWKNHVKTEPIPEGIKSVVRNKVPGLLMSNPGTSNFSAIRTALQTDNDFNIMAGCMVLRWLFERFSVMGVTLFNKALVSYNAGLYQKFLTEGGSTRPNLEVTDTATLVANKSVPQESKSYLLKVLGNDGFMDLYYGQKLIEPISSIISEVNASAVISGGLNSFGSGLANYFN